MFPNWPMIGSPMNGQEISQREELEYGFVHTIHRELQQGGTDKEKVISDTKMQRQDSER